MTSPPTLQTGFPGQGKTLLASVMTGVLGTLGVAGMLALVVFVQEIVEENNTEVPEHLVTHYEETPKKKKKTPVSSAPERLITASGGPALVWQEPSDAAQEIPKFIEIQDPAEPQPDLLVSEDFEEFPFEEVKPAEPAPKTPQKTRTVSNESTPAKRQGPSQAELDRREQRRLAALANTISKQASVVSRSTPHYPKSARRKRLEGRVVITVTVSPSGKVSACQISKSSGHASLDQSALSAARRHRFRPAMNGLGQAVSVKKVMPFQFQLAS